MRKTSTITILAAAACLALSSYAADITPPPIKADIADIGANYFDVVSDHLGKAEKSILIAMYEIHAYREKDGTFATDRRLVNRLVQSLIDAHNRNVDVKVYLDRTWRKDSGRTAVHASNQTVFEILRDTGIDVKFVSAKQRLHAKWIVIDDKIVVDGSTNWSYSALTRNTESALVIYSEEYARRIRSHIEQLETRQPEEDVVPIPSAFLIDPNLAPRMIQQSAAHPFNLYLLLLRRAADTGSSIVTAEYDELAEALGMKMSEEKKTHRGSVRNVLVAMQKQYGLIERSSLGHAKVDISLLPQSGAPFNVPKAYWDAGWSRRLTMPASLMYLISRYKRETSKIYPWWQSSHAQLSEDFGIGLTALNRGLRELENFGIQDVERASAPKGTTIDNRPPNKYYLLPLLTQAEINAQWQALADKYGKETAQSARDLTNLIGTDHNIIDVTKVAEAIQEYGIEAATDACQLVGKRTRQDGRRHVEYAIGIMDKKRSEQTDQ